MEALARLLGTLMFLSLLVACTGAPTPAETPGPTNTVAPTQAALKQPSNQETTEDTALPQPTPSDPSYLSPAIEMNTGRATHTATLMPDGRVLIAGGFREVGTSEISIASAEIYDPETGAFTPTGNMNEARRGHAATLLPNGLVLIVGGWGESGRITTAELYDPQTGEFRLAASMFAPRGSMTLTLLKNGQVLIAGGDSARNTPQLTAEIYDPATDTFSRSGSLNHGRSAHTATLLNDGKVLFIGGRPRSNNATALASAELYDPETGQFIMTSSMNVVRYKHAAVLLQDGNVLVIGGSNQHDWSGQYASAELYDTGTGEFTEIPDMNSARFKLADAAVLLSNGDVLIGGGNRQIEVYNTQNQRFLTDGNLDEAYFFSVLTLLQDGRVLITGGYDSRIQPSEKAWVFSYS
jgi:WD40 repeat protein